jgi:hypothetical protein
VICAGLVLVRAVLVRAVLVRAVLVRAVLVRAVLVRAASVSAERRRIHFLARTWICGNEHARIRLKQSVPTLIQARHLITVYKILH